jgi:hypothetical protein
MPLNLLLLQPCSQRSVVDVLSNRSNKQIITSSLKPNGHTDYLDQELDGDALMLMVMIYV